MGYILATLVPMLFGLVNYFVVDFRSSPVVPWDIYSIRTAASVAGNYQFHITSRLLLVLAGFAVIILISSRMSNVSIKNKVRFPSLLIMLILMFCFGKGIQTDQVIDAVGLDTILFTPNVLYRNNGIACGFIGNLKYLKVEKPAGYSAEKAQLIAEETSEQPEETGSEEYPNIIVIMDEAFSDLSVFGDFETDSDYMPFIRSLQENTVKGDCYVSVKGGNTANSEFEFLTGNSMAFMPSGSVPYQQYIKSELPSMASRLAKLGYQTAAIHPYNSTGWCRNVVYPYLGFEEAVFKSQFTEPVTIRSYISDESAFQKIQELYENKEEGKPLFVFEVTMQNHGGYSKDVEGFTESVHVTGLEDKTTSVRALEKYLTLIKETDLAFENLIQYFNDQSEKTIILLFGDHQPSDYVTNVVLRNLGLTREGSDEIFYNNYIVPYVMWANYDISNSVSDTADEITSEKKESGWRNPISLNYLGSLLAEKAGIPLTGYEQFLKKLQEVYPVVTANMVMDAEGNRMPFEEVKKDDWIRKYSYLTYNYLCDKKEKLTDYYD
ncbi:MAG: LTA synthase family protein [Muricoprocola sp.]